MKELIATMKSREKGFKLAIQKLTVSRITIEVANIFHISQDRSCESTGSTGKSNIRKEIAFERINNKRIDINEQMILNQKFQLINIFPFCWISGPRKQKAYIKKRKSYNYKYRVYNKRFFYLQEAVYYPSLLFDQLHKK